MSTIIELVKEWREAGPVVWSEDTHGWIENGQAITLAPWQRAALSAWWEHRTVTRLLALSNIKKTGKTLTNAILTGWRWLCLPGEHFCAANDQEQSSARQFAMVAEMVKHHPILRRHVKIGNKQCLFVPTGSTLTALAVDATGNAGANHLTASHTEAWGIEHEGAVRAWEELSPPPGLFYGMPALRVCDSYCGFEGQSKTWHGVVDRGLQGELISADWPIYQAGGLLLFHIEGEEAQERCFRGTPAEAARYYQEQQAEYVGREGTYQRHHLNRRATSEGNFCEASAWQACFSAEHRPLLPGDTRPVYVGLDLATSAGGDNAAAVGVYLDGGIVKLAFHRVWNNLARQKIKGAREGQDRLKLKETVYPFLLTVKQKYNLQAVLFDVYQGLSLAEDLRAKGLKLIEVPQTKSMNGRAGKDTLLQQLVNDRRLMLYSHSDLNALSSMAIVEELANGLVFIKKAARRQKIDLLIALSNCCDEATRPPKVAGPLLYGIARRGEF